MDQSLSTNRLAENTVRVLGVPEETAVWAVTAVALPASLFRLQKEVTKPHRVPG